MRRSSTYFAALLLIVPLYVQAKPYLHKHHHSAHKGRPSNQHQVVPVTSPSIITMANSFAGHYTPEQIKPTLDRSLVLYGEPVTEDSYERAGRCLQLARNKYGVSEMAVLEYMNRSAIQPGLIKFPEGVATAAFFIKHGDN